MGVMNKTSSLLVVLPYYNQFMDNIDNIEQFWQQGW